MSRTARHAAERPEGLRARGSKAVGSRLWAQMRAAGLAAGAEESAECRERVDPGEVRRRMAMRLLFLLVLTGAAVGASSALAPTLSSTDDLCVSGHATAVNSAPPGATFPQAGSPRGLSHPRVLSRPCLFFLPPLLLRCAQRRARACCPDRPLLCRRSLAPSPAAVCYFCNRQPLHMPCVFCFSCAQARECVRKSVRKSVSVSVCAPFPSFFFSPLAYDLGLSCT